MSVSAGKIAGTVLRGLLWIGLVLFVLLALGVLYLILFPPFRIPETGSLESNMEREVTLRPDAPVALIELDVRHDATIFSKSGNLFQPTQMAITSTVAGESDGPYALRLYPGDARPIADLSLAADGRSVETLIGCANKRAIECDRRYLLVLSAPGIATELRIRVEVRARLQFPPHVEAPFLASIRLEAREMPAGAPGATVQPAAVEGSTSLSPDAPAVWQALSFPVANGRSSPGLSLQVTATRTGAMIPVGLRAPPPVRVLLVAADGRVVLDLGVRAGGAVGAAVPALEGDHRLVILWRDRADQAYEVGWRIEQNAIGDAPAPPITAGALERAPSVAEKTTMGETSLIVNDGQPYLNFGVGIDLGDTDSEHLGPVAGVVRLQLELVKPASGTVTVLLAPGGSSGPEETALELRSGEPVDLTLEAVGGCVYRCDPPWHLEVPTQPSPPGLPQPGDEVSIRWRASFELWDLDPSTEPPRPYFYELEFGA